MVADGGRCVGGWCAFRVAPDSGATVRSSADGCGARPRTRPQIDILRPVRGLPATAIRDRQVGCGPSIRRTCTWALPGDGTFVLTRRAEEPRPVTARLRAQAARWNTTYASCTRIRLSPAASLLPTWSASRSVSVKCFAFAARKWCIVGHRSSRRPVLRLVDVSRS